MFGLLIYPGRLCFPIRDNEDFNGTTRNVKKNHNGQRGIFKGDMSSDASFSIL